MIMYFSSLQTTAHLNKRTPLSTFYLFVYIVVMVSDKQTNKQMDKQTDSQVRTKTLKKKEMELEEPKPAAGTRWMIVIEVLLSLSVPHSSKQTNPLEHTHTRTQTNLPVFSYPAPDILKFYSLLNCNH